MPGRILLIDPVSASRIVLRFRLEANCYTVLASATSREALNHGRSFKPDLILIADERGGPNSLDLIATFANRSETRHAPVLILASGVDPAQRIALLRAGAEDVLDRSTHEELLPARLRGLMRRRATADEVVQRDSTERELALAEPHAHFERPGSVVLVAPEPRQAQAWARALAQRIPDRLEVRTAETALAQSSAKPVPDAFLVVVGTGSRDPGLRLLSELRSHSETRHAAVLVIMEAGSSDPYACWDRAAMALDIGAGDIALYGFDETEIALRVRRQIALKKKADHLRNTVRDGLRLALCDPLTGLYNRRYALPHLARIASAARDRRAPFATMLLDLDRFKAVNDTFGHAAGDAVLVAVASTLRNNLRSHDLLARIGGEEFLIAMPDTDRLAAREAADRLRERVRRETIALPGEAGRINITCSIGVSVTQPDATVLAAAVPDISGLIEDADGALYRSKEIGRDSTCFARSAA